MFDCAIHGDDLHHQFASDTGRIELTDEAICGGDRPIIVPGSSAFRWTLTGRLNESELQIEFQNLGAMILDGQGRRIHPAEVVTLESPLQLWMGQTLIELVPHSLPTWLSESTVRLPTNLDMKEPGKWDSDSIGHAPSSVTLANWFDALGRLHRSNTKNPRFYTDAATSLLDPGGLDAGIILLKRKNGWEVVGSDLGRPESGLAWHRDLLDRVVKDPHTVFHSAGGESAPSNPSRFSYGVCAPVLDENKQVVAAVYGMRARHRMNQRRGIRSLEAQFVQHVAEGVSAAMIRQQRETELARRQVLLEQAFPPAVVERLVNEPKILEGNQREISVLFCDMRGFSRICDRLAGAQIYRLLSQIMDLLTDRIRENQGVVIDYFGDGLAAFWNAPVDQPGHPDLACRAALEMMEDIQAVNEEWIDGIGFPISVGIGIHTGDALVGNSGSKYRIKYGPRGQTVNTACRIESATKSLGLPVLISRAASIGLGDDFRTRSVGRIRLPGIEYPIDLYQPVEKSSYDVRRRELECYERALADFQSEQFAMCLATLDTIPASSIIEPRSFEFLRELSLARLEGRYNRRHDDQDFEFMTNPSDEADQGKKSRSNGHR